MRRPNKRKTKIVCTLGPASNSREVIREMILTGMNVARLNFSHGSYDEHERILNIIREESNSTQQHVAVLQDLSGPKVRISDVEDGQIMVPDGGHITLRYAVDKSECLGTLDSLYVESFNPGQVLKVGHKALLADGRIALVAESVGEDEVLCKVLSGGPLRSRSGISVPESQLDLPCLTEKDRKDLEWGVKHDVDYIALSFVASSQDIIDAKTLVEKHGADIPIVAKVERAVSMDHISSIVESSDAVMVARGDLGLELPLERVPTAQRLIIRTANFAGTPVITATQMLMSMVNELRPTRAEVTDVATAVRDGTDAVMLSDETAMGHHPVESVRVLSNIVVEAERELNYERTRASLKRSDSAKVPDAVCYAACSAAEKISSNCIVACTESGYTARLMAKYRPVQNLFGVTNHVSSLRRMALYWGVEPVLIDQEDVQAEEDEIQQTIILIRDTFGIKPGARVVVTAGLKAHHVGSTNIMQIREIPRTS